MPDTTIYHDGDCPLCRAEVAHYLRKDSSGALTLVNVADPASKLPNGTDRAAALGRFHATAADGRGLSGAAAFVEVGRRLPRWRVMARIARFLGVTLAMEGGYRLFLPLFLPSHPVLMRAFVLLEGLRGQT